MPPTDPEQPHENLARRLLLLGIIEAPGLILICLGLLGKFAEPGAAFHPLLDNSTATTAMIVIGGVIVAWASIQMIAIARHRSRVP